MYRQRVRKIRTQKDALRQLVRAYQMYSAISTVSLVHDAHGKTVGSVRNCVFVAMDLPFYTRVPLPMRTWGGKIGPPSSKHDYRTVITALRELRLTTNTRRLP